MKGPHVNFIHLTILFWNITTAIEYLRCFKSISHHHIFQREVLSAFFYFLFREKRWRKHIHIYYIILKYVHDMQYEIN